MKWTKDQEFAINKDKTNIIVSAGAGSGKTAVLTERVLRMIREGIDIRKILILTFTNEAAGEMKNRIRDKMVKEGFNKQLLYLDSAFITTFDAFSLSVVKKYHYVLNVSRDIKIIDSSLIKLEKKRILDQIFLENYQKKDSRFLKLVGDFTVRDDEAIKKSILSINEILDLKYDKKIFLENYLDTFFREEKYQNLIDEYFCYLKSLCFLIEEDFYALEEFLDDKLYQKLGDAIKPAIKPKSYDNLFNININLPKFRDVPEEAINLKERLKEEVNELNSLTIYKKEELIYQLNSTKDYVSVIIDIILEFDEKMHEYKRIHEAFEFIDIAKMAIKIVKDYPKIREELRDSFHEIMIDEYQDTNDLQELFINYISNHNVYMVGDIKQSIYRFRNANPKIFKEKYEQYKNNCGGIAIDLLNNFRSRSEVLDSINLIFSHIMTQEIGDVNFKNNHAMILGNKSYQENGQSNNSYQLEILKYPRDYQEYSALEIEIFTIANDIKKKVEEKYQVFDFKLNALRDINYSDFSIILDRGTDMPTYKKIFEYLSIPLDVYQDSNITNGVEIYLIKNIIGLILSIKNKSYDDKMRYYFTSIARSYLCSMTDAEIFYIFDHNLFYDTEIFKLCSKLCENLSSKTPNMLLNDIIDAFNFYENLIKVGDIESAEARLNYMLDLSLNIETLGLTIEDFIDFLDDILDSNLDIRYKNIKVNSNSVKIMNIHKSKGLEFPICYYAGLTKKFNLKDLNDRFTFDSTYGILTPFYEDGIGTLFTKTLIKNKYYQEEISEKIRLFYVALTRAKEKIIMVLPEFKETNFVKDCITYYAGISCRSFYDFLNSISGNLNKYVKCINLEDLNLTHEYEFIKKPEELKKKENYQEIKFVENNVESKVLENKHASKTILNVISKKENELLEFGTKMHHILEMTDFRNIKTDNPYIKHLLNTFNFKDAIIYQELEFIFSDKETEYHGIIDLMLEHEKEIDIIDYKLKNIDDDDYQKQLEVYYKYIKSISNKDINLYLYSILDKKVKKIDNIMAK